MLRAQPLKTVAYNSDLPFTSTRDSPNTAAAVRGWAPPTAACTTPTCTHAGIDFEPILDQMKEHIVRLLHHFEPHLRSSAYRYPHGPDSFFAMFRFDFLLDPNLQPWLIEINQSPNLSSDSNADLSNMFQRISWSLLNLMGFGHGQLRWPGNPPDQAEVIAHHNDIDIGWRLCTACGDSCEGDCTICRRCRTPEQSKMLRVRLCRHLQPHISSHTPTSRTTTSLACSSCRAVPQLAVSAPRCRVFHSVERITPSASS